MKLKKIEQTGYHIGGPKQDLIIGPDGDASSFRLGGANKRQVVDKYGAATGYVVGGPTAKQFIGPNGSPTSFQIGGPNRRDILGPTAILPWQRRQTGST